MAQDWVCSLELDLHVWRMGLWGKTRRMGLWGKQENRDCEENRKNCVCVFERGQQGGGGERGKKGPFYVLLLYIYVVLAQAGKVCVDSFDEE